MNVKLLREIQKAIRNKPKQFIMHKWFEKSENYPNCHTAACIGGWAVTLGRSTSKKPADGYDLWGTIHGNPREILKLTINQASRLFYVSAWPDKFRKRFETDLFPNAEHNAKVAAARISHFIKTEGRE